MPVVGGFPKPVRKHPNMLPVFHGKIPSSVSTHLSQIASIVGVGERHWFPCNLRGGAPKKTRRCLSRLPKEMLRIPMFSRQSLFFFSRVTLPTQNNICYIEGSFCGETREFVCINHVCPSIMSPGTWCRPRWYQPTKLVHSVSSVAWTPHLIAVVKVGLNKLTKGGAHLLWVSSSVWANWIYTLPWTANIQSHRNWWEDMTKHTQKPINQTPSQKVFGCLGLCGKSPSRLWVSTWASAPLEDHPA